jgi:hypothetical protein
VRWHLSWKADPRVRALADRHYSRQKVGAAQFVPPGACLVLVTERADAAWITSAPMAEYVHHAWAGAWTCTMFRNESEWPDRLLSSELIKDAVAATAARMGPVPDLGFVTFVAAGKVKKKRDPGRCYLRAGWHYEPCARCAGHGDLPDYEWTVDGTTLSLPERPPAARWRRQCPDCEGDGRARTKTERLLVLRLAPALCGPPVEPLGSQTHLWRQREARP